MTPIASDLRTAAVAHDPAALAAKLRLAVARLARRLRQEDQGGLSQPQISALSTLQHGPRTGSELAAAEHVQPPTMPVLVAKLEAAGLVAREADPTDRRVSRIRIRAEGLRLLERVRSRRTAFLARRLRTLGEEDRRVLDRAAEIVDRLLREQP